MDSPSPVPGSPAVCALEARTNRLNSCPASAGRDADAGVGHVDPPLVARRTSAVTRTRWFRCENLTAFAIRLSSTCISRRRSPRPDGPVPAR